ncbi:MAG: PAS domain-containing protein, partial [Boseongicola sp.]|nr:PAS domain-containing protein [Boseongicola sp.]
MIATVVAISVTNFMSIRDSIVGKTEEKLDGITQVQSERIADFFNVLDRDLTLRAESGVVAEAIKAFAGAFAAYENPKEDLQTIYIHDNPHPAGEKDQLTTAGTNHVYDWTHTKYHPYFDALQDAMGYYDVFLFDTDGNLVYSVFKELDYATNMETGEWRETGLAAVFRQANEATAEDTTTFQDFAPYEPSFGAPAAFFARPVFDAAGKRIGVLAFQAPIDAINQMMNGLDALDGTGDAILVGGDSLLRSDSPLSEESDILQTRIDTGFVRDGLAGGAGFLQHVNAAGDLYLVSYRPIDIFGARWVVVARQDSTEMNYQLNNAMTETAMVALVAIAIAGAIMLALARSISQPLKNLTSTVEAIARKQFEVAVPATDRGDELGHIAAAVETFRVKLKTAEENLFEIAFKSAAFEVSGAPMLMTDMDFNIRLLNESLSNMMRERADDFRTIIKDFDPDQLMGKNMDVFHVIPEKARKILANPENLPFKTKIAVGNAFVGLLVDAILDVDGNQIGYVLDWKDQTFHMENQVIMEAIDTGQGRVEIDLDHRIRTTNSLFADCIGNDPDDVVGMSLERVLTRESDDGADTDLWDAAGGGEVVFDRFRLALGTKDIIIAGCMSRVPNHKGQTKGYLLLGTDVTEDRKAAIDTERRQQEMAAAQASVVEAFQSSLTKLSGGDLMAEIDAEFSEEYEALRMNYNNAVTSLHDAMLDVLEANVLIRENSEEIRSATDDLSKRTEKQAATLEETSAALNELTTSVKSASEGAQQASSVVNHARENAETSGEVVRDAVAAMGEIEKSSQAISNITSVIDDIAFQTNLLALNAGVEAARAGDA